MMGPEHGMNASLSYPVRTASVRRDGERETMCMDDAVGLGPRAGAIVVRAQRTMVEQGYGPGTATQGPFSFVLTFEDCADAQDDVEDMVDIQLCRILGIRRLERRGVAACI